MNIKRVIIIFIGSVIIITTSCSNNMVNEIDGSPSATPTNNEIIKPIINIEDVLSEIPYDATFPEKAGLITNNQYYRIVKFEYPTKREQGGISVFYQRGCNSGILVYTLFLGETNEYKTVYKRGLMDQNFNIITEAEFDKIHSFGAGCAIVKKDDLFGVVNKDGVSILDCLYKNTPIVGSQMIKVQISKYENDITYDYFDKVSGEFLFTVEKTYNESTLMYQLYVLKKDGGKELVEYIEGWDNEPIQTFVNGETNLWGYKDNDGNILTEAIFQETHPFFEGRARVKLDGKYGFVNEYGEIIIATDYDMAYDFSEGMARVLNGRRYGYIDTSGNLLIDCKYVKAGDFGNGLASVKSFGGDFNYINTKDEIAIRGNFVSAGSFSNGFAPVQDQVKGLYRYIDIYGNTVFSSMKFDTADEFNDDGYAFATQMTTIEVENIEEGWEGNSGVYDIYLIYIKPE
jgi:hypothetical protein